MTSAEKQRLVEADAGLRPWRAWGRTWPSAPGGRCGRTTRRTGTPGAPSRTSTRAPALAEIADDIAHRLVRLFLDDADGRRPVFGGQRLFQADPDWHDLLPFHEYFHGDTGTG